MLDKTEMIEAMEYLAGSCKTPREALADCGFPDTSENIELFGYFLDDNECMECECCGWWSHPGEQIDSYCDDCLAEKEEDE